MHTVDLKALAQLPFAEHAKALTAEIESLETAARVYRTRCDGVTLTTTSKEVHLSLGRFSLSGLRHFCALISAEAEKGHDKELLLADGKHSSLLITIIDEKSGGRIFNLAPAH
ncbi:MAG TPA: hypothetical protein VHC68_00410 [Candidatus Paceibacterota bacterium]|nr:hypothetical protein [Candidatus Paceibacterota bacterium]